MNARGAISASQVSSRGNTSLRKNHGAQIGEDHHNAPHPLHRGKITIEQLVERYESVYVEGAWLPDGTEGLIAWVGGQAGLAFHELQSALASAVIAAGGEVNSAPRHDKKTTPAIALTAGAR